MSASDDQEKVHMDALVHAFVLPRYRERLLRKPRQLLDEFCHVLPDKLDPRRVVPLGDAVKSAAAAVSLLRRISSRQTAHYLGAWAEYEPGEYPLDVAVGMVEETGGAAASVEAGEVVYYKMEGCPKGERFLLVKDAGRREAALEFVKNDRRARN